MKFSLFVLFIGLIGSCYGRATKHKCKPSSLPPSRNSNCCGIDTTSSLSIVGGSKTDVKQYPWMALIEYRQYWYSNDLLQLCGGFLISSRFVVSAAHCFAGIESQPVSVLLGEYDTSHDGRDCARVHGVNHCTGGEVRIEIDRYLTHERYNPKTDAHDIALIRLTKNAPYRDYIRPICLPEKDIAEYADDQTVLSSAGWGVYKQEDEDTTPNIKRHVFLPFVEKELCEYVHRLRDTFVPKDHICAGGQEGKDVCMGDSGGPLMYERQGVYEAVGIVSFGPGEPCEERGVPGAYTNVYRYLKWIYKHIGMQSRRNFEETDYNEVDTEGW